MNGLKLHKKNFYNKNKEEQIIIFLVKAACKEILQHIIHMFAEIQKGYLCVTVEFNIRGCNQTFPDWVHNKLYAYLWYYSRRSNTKVYGGKTHWTDSQNSDKTAPSGRELYHLQFSLKAASPDIFGYTFV
jgi:hypothetical protein